MKIKNLGSRHFQNNFIIYFSITMFLLIGIIIGAVLINRLTYEQNYKLISRVSWLFDNEVNTNTVEIFKTTLFSNLKFLLIICLIGLTSLGIVIVPLMISFRGGIIGFTVGYLIKEYGFKGFIFSLSGLLPNYLIILPGILGIGAVGLSNAINSKRTKLSNPLHRVNQKRLIDYSVLFVLLFLVIALGCIIEAFTTPYFLKIIGINL